MSGDEAPVVPPGTTDEAHPEIFNIEARPKVPENKPGQLSDEAIQKFFTDGYVIVEDFFSHEDLDPCRDAVNEEVEELAQRLYSAGKIKDLYRECGFFERLSKIESDFPGANIILHKEGKLPQAFKNLWSNERLLNVIEQLIGPDIAGHPVWNLRTKTPQNEATTVPWHQDAAYLDNSAYKVLQPTAWIPLLDANEHNGCMEIVRRGHKTGKVATHECCYGDTWYVMLGEHEMERKLDVDMKKDCVVCPVPYGGMLLFNNLIPHRSLPNMSNQIRWSLDLRWHNPNLPNGYYGMKKSVLMRTSKNPNFKIDWSSFENVARHPAMHKQVKDREEFDTTIHGLWMKKWDIVHVNRHTQSLAASEKFDNWKNQKA